MPLLPKLSPLQSRLAASVMASVMLILLYLAFSFPHFAYAAEVDSIRPEDHNHERLLEYPLLDFGFDELEELGESEYQPEFLGADRGIIGRATTTPTSLTNNAREAINIDQGTLVSYMFTNASLWATKASSISDLPSEISVGGMTMQDVLKADQSNSSSVRTLYITVSTCTQPTSNTSTSPPPQLMLYVSQSENNTTPGPSQSSTLQEAVELEEGYVLYTVNATGNVYIGVYGYARTGYDGVYNAQIAASIDMPYHYYWNVSDPNLFLVDSDDDTALLFTNNIIPSASNTTLLEEWMDIGTPPFVMFASDGNNTAINGLRYSYCGLALTADITSGGTGRATTNIKTGMTDIGAGTLPKQQFYVDGLSAGKTYNVVLAMHGNSTNNGDSTGIVPGGGGQVFRMTSIQTLSSSTCQVMYDLQFCDQVAYSVPANQNAFPTVEKLSAWYDNTTQALYEYFKNVLAQIPCNTTSSAQYSLARTCSDCANAYKTWLCSVMIPRCTDFSSPTSYYQPRAIGQPFPDGTFLPLATRQFYNNSAAFNGSRNLMIDQTIQPGPYKEILPCEDLCFDLVQSCPASMGFSCPQIGNIGFNTSYGQKPRGGVTDSNGQVVNLTCNYPGATHGYNGGGLVLPSWGLLGGMLVLGLVLI